MTVPGTGTPSADFIAHMRAGGRLALICDIDHPVTPVHVWSGTNTLTWNGNDYQGVGILGKITAPDSQTMLGVQQVTFEMSGLPPSSTKFLGANMKRRSARAWLAALRKMTVLDVFLAVDALLDYPSMKTAQDGTVTISLTGNVGFWSIDRALDLVWSHEWQISRYPTDTGLSMMSSLISKASNWRLP